MQPIQSMFQINFPATILVTILVMCASGPQYGACIHTKNMETSPLICDNGHVFVYNSALVCASLDPVLWVMISILYIDDKSSRSVTCPT